MSVQALRGNVELTAEELKLAKANVQYAIDTCSPDGIQADDGQSADKSLYEALLNKLNAIQIQATNQIGLTSEELKFLIAAAKFAEDFCPVEGGVVMEDGQSSTRDMFTAYLEKLQSFQGPK
jgi:hypothetical protein